MRVIYKTMGGVCYLLALLASFFLLIHFAQMYEAGMGRLEVTDKGQFATEILLTSAILSAIVYLLGKLGEKLIQKQIDLEATRLLEDIYAGRNRRFFLYLRPFDTTGKLRTDNNLTMSH